MMKEERAYLELEKQFEALEGEIQTANGRANEIQERITEEQQKLEALTEKKREAARAYAGGGSPVALNKLQGEITQQQGTIEGLEETLAMIREVAREKRQALVKVEAEMELAHSDYWRAVAEKTMAGGFEQARKILITAWRAQWASGAIVPFYDFAQRFFNEVSQDEAQAFPIEVKKVPECFPQSTLLRYEDRKYG